LIIITVIIVGVVFGCLLHNNNILP